MTTQPVLCPKCNAPMILRTKKNTSFQFYGCSTFPKCNGYKPYSATKVERNSVPQKKIEGSAQQKAFWSACTGNPKHKILRARAGCGKTTTSVALLDYLSNVKVGFFAFNRHIVAELKARTPESVKVATIHSFALAQVKAWNPRVIIDDSKLDRILDGLVAEDDNSEYIKSATAKLVNLCKANLYDGTNESQLDELVLKHGIDLNDHVSQVYTIVPQAIRQSKASKNVVDFSDMLWFIYAHNISVETFDYAIFDEIQDFNKLQHYVALKLTGNGVFVGVGDDLQAIYGFAGADVHSMQTLIDMLSNTARGVEVLPLTATRRCPVSHIDLAQKIVPDIENLPDAPIGSVESVGLEFAVNKMQANDLGICRRNAPLIKVAYSLIRAGKSVTVKGRDIGLGLQALIKKLRAGDIISLIDKAEAYRAKELEKLESKGKKGENARQALNDKIDTLIALTDGIDDISELKAKINTLFSDQDNSGKIILSSVHRAKGLESDRVFVIEYSRIRLSLSQPDAQQQEANLEYIALTRSKNELYLVD